VRAVQVWRTTARILICVVVTTAFASRAATVLATPSSCLFSLDNVSGQAPHFEDFKVSAELKRAPAPVILSSSEDREFRTQLRKGAAHGPNFAGHYTVVVWGCGSSCTDWAIVDATSGRVTFLADLRAISGTHVISEKSDTAEYWGLRFRADSRLIIVVGAPNEDQGREGIAYYSWNGRSVDLLKFLPASQLCPPPTKP